VAAEGEALGLPCLAYYHCSTAAAVKKEGLALYVNFNSVVMILSRFPTKANNIGLYIGHFFVSVTSPKQSYPVKSLQWW
jgi:hypothetical protein